MSDLNIDDFYQDVARVLVALYRVFPRPQAIYAEDICGPDETDEYGLHSHRYQACFAAMVWLGEEGFIRYEDVIRQDAIDQAVLSARCFAVLLQTSADDADSDVPAAVRERRSTRAYQLEQAIRQRQPLTEQRLVQGLIERLAR